MRFIDFGWLPEPLKLDLNTFHIEPHQNYDSALAAVRNSPRVQDGWYLPSLEPPWMSNEDLGTVTISYSPIFQLALSHRLFFDHEDDKLGELLVAVLGVLVGLQLVPAGFGHFYRTPIELYKFSDAKPTREALGRILEMAAEFWLRNKSIRALLYGALHAHMFGLSYQHDFERFAMSYSVLDTCWRLHAEINSISPSQSPSHSARIVTLCAAYNLSLPTWAILNSRGVSRLSALRNEYFHECRWGGHPIGFDSPADVPNIELELFWFNTRLLLALLGDTSSYTRSPITNQGMMILR